MSTPKVSCSCCGKPIVYTTGVVTPLRWVYLKNVAEEIVAWVDPTDDRSLCVGCVKDMAQFKES